MRSPDRYLSTGTDINDTAEICLHVLNQIDLSDVSIFRDSFTNGYLSSSDSDTILNAALETEMILMSPL